MNYNERIDYSSLSTYLECPRKFFFQYVLHFRSSRPSIHLVFGSCWHYGLEESYKYIAERTDLKVTPILMRDVSIAAFNKLWALEGAPHFDPDLVYPKAPGRAADMYNKYWKEYLEEDIEKKIIGVEVPFTISLRILDDLFDTTEEDETAFLPDYIGRMDLVFESPDGSLEIVDHKTASSINVVTPISFQASMQTDGYLTAGHMFFDKIPSMTYSVALCQKTKIAFERFTFQKRMSALDRFLLDLSAHCESIQEDLALYELEKAETSRTHVMRCFRRKSGYACTQFFSACPYFDLCQNRNNPATWHDNPPQGYSVNEWDPAIHEAELKRKLEEVS